MDECFGKNSYTECETQDENRHKCEWIDGCYNVQDLIKNIGESEVLYNSNSECELYADDENLCNTQNTSTDISCEYVQRCESVSFIKLLRKPI